MVLLLIYSAWYIPTASYAVRVSTRTGRLLIGPVRETRVESSVRSRMAFVWRIPAAGREAGAEPWPEPSPRTRACMRACGVKGCCTGVQAQVQVQVVYVSWYVSHRTGLCSIYSCSLYVQSQRPEHSAVVRPRARRIFTRRKLHSKLALHKITTVKTQ